MVDMQGQATFCASKRLLHNQRQSGKWCLIPYTSYAYMESLVPRHTATFDEVQMGLYGLAIGYVGNILHDPTVLTTCVLWLPTTVRKLALGDNPAGVNTSQLPVLKSLGMSFSYNVGLHGTNDAALSETPLTDGTPVHLGTDGRIVSSRNDPSCVICFEYPAQYLWAGCHHPRKHRQKLICHRCCNVLRRIHLGSLSIRGTGHVSLPCILCQKVSRVI